MLRLYGPTGAATGWRLWIDAWALAQREPVIREVLRRLDQRWSAVLLEVVEDGVADGVVQLSRPRGRRGPGLGAARRAVGRHAGLPHASPARSCAQWVADAVAGELA